MCGTFGFAYALCLYYIIYVTVLKSYECVTSMVGRIGCGMTFRRVTDLSFISGSLKFGYVFYTKEEIV